MTAEAAIALVLQLLALFPKVEPAIVQGIKDIKDLIAGGGTPTQADLDALFARAKAQSQQIQDL